MTPMSDKKPVDPVENKDVPVESADAPEVSESSDTVEPAFPEEPVEPTETKSRRGIGKTILSALPGIAIGVGTVLTVKAALVTAPIWASVAAAAAALGVVTTKIEHVKNVHATRKAQAAAGVEVNSRIKDYFNVKSYAKTATSKKTLLKASFNAAAVVVGGVIGNFVDFGIFADKPDFEPVVAPEPPLPEPAPIEETVIETIVNQENIEAAITPISVLDRVGEVLDSVTTETSTVSEAFAAAVTGDMQAQKDLAYFMFNGFEGVPMDKSLAAELFAGAADAGNVQAQTDVAYIQYHGLVQDVIPQDQAAALQTINELGRSWVGGEALLEKAAVTAKAVTP